jgi:hypothetical protein
VYRFWRSLIRLWFAITFRKIRVRHPERLEEPDPALLIVCHPAGYLDALVLVAGIARPVRCLIPAGLIRGFLQALVARGLGIISFSPAERKSARKRCSALLAQKAAVVTFLEPGPPADIGEDSVLVTDAAAIAVEAERGESSSARLLLLPVYLFLPVGHTLTRESVIDIDQPMIARDYISGAGGNFEDRAQELSKPLERRCKENPFRLQPADFNDFLGMIEQALRVGAQEEYESKAARKQTLDGFALSRFVVLWGKQMNYLQPARLISLRESLERWRETRRVSALHRLHAERAGPWLKRPVGRALIWLESVAGAALAVYALINNFVAIVVLFVSGLLRKESGRDKITEWLWRGLVVLGCYAAQVFEVGHFLGRRMAGYYAPTLPLSALYLWRYIGLLSNQTRIAFYSLNQAAAAANTNRLLMRFLDEINQALDRHAELISLPH